MCQLTGQTLAYAFSICCMIEWSGRWVSVSVCSRPTHCWEFIFPGSLFYTSRSNCCLEPRAVAVSTVTHRSWSSWWHANSSLQLKNKGTVCALFYFLLLLLSAVISTFISTLELGCRVRNLTFCAFTLDVLSFISSSTSPTASPSSSAVSLHRWLVRRGWFLCHFRSCLFLFLFFFFSASKSAAGSSRQSQGHGGPFLFLVLLFRLAWTSAPEGLSPGSDPSGPWRRTSPGACDAGVRRWGLISPRRYSKKARWLGQMIESKHTLPPLKGC